MAVTVMNLKDGSKQYFTCSPREAVLSAYAHSVKNGNTWQYEQFYGRLIIEGKMTISCGDFSAFKDGREF